MALNRSHTGYYSHHSNRAHGACDYNRRNKYAKKAAKWDKIAKTHKATPFFSVSQKLENLATYRASLSNLYYRMFYQKMLETELSMTNLESGANILHIGSGPYPYTALFLAEQGYQVEAWDCRADAVYKASEVVKQKGWEKHVKIYCQDGSMANYAKHDAIWVSLNVYPKRDILQQAYSQLKKGGVLVYRNLPRWMNLFFSQIKPEDWPKHIIKGHHATLFSSESVVLVKHHLRRVP